MSQFIFAITVGMSVSSDWQERNIILFSKKTPNLSDLFIFFLLERYRGLRYCKFQTELLRSMFIVQKLMLRIWVACCYFNSLDSSVLCFVVMFQTNHSNVACVHSCFLCTVINVTRWTCLWRSYRGNISCFL